MAWLNDNPPARSQFRHPRREQVSGVFAVHTAENAPDYVAFDGGAEAVARFIRDRSTPGSYHRLADSDSVIELVELGDEAFHDGTGTNPHSIGLSVATRADVWPLAPADWRAGAVANLAGAAAEAAAYVKAKRGIVVPARRITADQARARVPGFVTHAELDPGRRTDPGAGFPWAAFLAAYARLNPDLEEDPLANLTDDEQRELLENTRRAARPGLVLVRRAGTRGMASVSLAFGLFRVGVPTQALADLYKYLLGQPKAVALRADWYDHLVEVDELDDLAALIKAAG